MWVDCTQTLAEDSPVLPPLHPAPEFEDFATLDGDGYNSTVLHLETHCGTHMDAPTHFFAPDDHRTIDEVTPAEMVTEGVVFDFSGKEPGSVVGREEFVERADRYGLGAGEYAVLDCGMSPRDDATYLENFVAPSAGVAEELVERDAAALAVDALSADRPGAALDEHAVHTTLLPNDVLIVEGVANLDQVPEGRVDVVCTPVPYAGRDGAQARVLLRSHSSSSSPSPSSSSSSAD